MVVLSGFSAGFHAQILNMKGEKIMAKKILAFLLAALMLVSIVACGGKKTEGDDTTEEATTEDTMQQVIDQVIQDALSTADTRPDSHYDNYNFNGHEFKFLNSAAVYYMYVYLDPEATGDVLDDSCAVRNVEAETKFNITITEETQPYKEIAAHAQTLILSGEDTYDAMYIGCQELTPLVSDNLFVDLLQIEELNIHSVWWDQPLIKRNIIEDRLFYATSDLNLMAFEGVWAMYFNETMMDELGYEVKDIYQAVQDGKWTMAKLDEYTKAAANINGDQSFTYSVDGNATYGEVTMSGVERYRLYGFNTEYVARDDNGRYQFTADTDDKFKSSWETIIGYFGANDGRFVYGSSTDLAEDGYFTIFMEDRALFLSAELKGATMLREWEGNFGLIPQPKYNEEQETYESTVFSNVLSFCIPQTNENLSRTGIIVDYLTYSSYIDLLPKYYEIHVGLKALSKQESKDSLALIRDTRGIEVSIPFEWTSELSSALAKLAQTNKLEIGSTIERYQDACKAAIEKTYKEYPEHSNVEG